MELGMRHLLIAGVIVLTSSVMPAAQEQRLDVKQTPLNLTLLAPAQLGEVLTQLARLGGITIEFDATVTETMRAASISEAIRLRDATLEQAIDAITSTNGLSYTVTGPRAIRISKKV
jgi:hypothetical protein